MNTIVFFILGWASFASADSSIGGYSYETPGYETPWVDQNSGWHPPQQIDRSSLANLLRTNARQAITDPMMMVGAGGAALNAVYTTVATAGVAKTVVAANGRIDASNKRISKVETRSSNTCSKLKTLVGIAAPTVSNLACTTSCSPPSTARSSTGIFSSCSTTAPSKGTADCVATNLLDTYYVQGVGTTGGKTVKAEGGLAEHKTVKIAETKNSDTALSVNDFNIFRKKVAEAINTLDKKMEQILGVTAPTC